MSGREDDTSAPFSPGTVLLSILPLAMIGGILVFLRRRVRAASARSAQPAA